MKRQGLHAAVQAGHLGVEDGGTAHRQSLAGETAGGVDVEHRRRARGESRGQAGARQVLELGVRRDLWRKVLDGDTGVQTVGVDLVEESQAGRVNHRLPAQQPVGVNTRIGISDVMNSKTFSSRAPQEAEGFHCIRRN